MQSHVDLQALVTPERHTRDTPDPGSTPDAGSLVDERQRPTSTPTSTTSGIRLEEVEITNKTSIAFRVLSESTLHYKTDGP